jgi:hypothetical protein
MGDLPDLTLPSGPNWVRFAHFTRWANHGPHDGALCPYTPVLPSLALFCAFCPAGEVKLGSFRTFGLFVEPAPDLIGGWASPPDIFRGGRDWVCSAHIVTNGTKSTAVNRAEKLFRRESSY